MLTKKEVEHIAFLAKLGLTEEEKEKFRKELSAILDYVAKLNEVETKDVEPMAGGTNLLNITREDKPLFETKEEGALEKEEIEAIKEAAELINVAPHKQDGYVKVKKIL